MRLFLDNMRDIPEKWHYCVARNYDDCVLLLSVFQNEIEYLSLDYDLGEGAKHSGLDVLIYMKEHGIKPVHINIHSTNLYGEPKMKAYVKEYFKGTIFTEDKIGKLIPAT